MNARFRYLWGFLLIGLLAFELSAYAQQDADVTVKVRAKSSVPPTLLVMCDLACDWKLDGEVKGHINAGSGAKVKVESGQHMVVAIAEGGIDQIEQSCTVKQTGQTMVNIEFQPIRNARIVAEEEVALEAKAETERAARERAEQKTQEKAKQERELESEIRLQPWTDLVTGLMWTKESSNGYLSWPAAMDYCRNLQQGGYSDWRLPTIDELSNLYGTYMKGDHIPEISLFTDSRSTGAWSSSRVLSKKGKVIYPYEAWAFDHALIGTNVSPIEDAGLENSAYRSAWCVRSVSKP